MTKFRYSTDGGSSWVYKDETLPYNLPVTAGQNVMVEPIGIAVTNNGTVSGNVLTLTYDASNPTQDITANTNTAGTFYWCITNSLTPPSPSAIAAGTGFIHAGNVATVAGALAITLPALSGASDLYFHAFVDGTSDTNIATVRAYIGTASTYIGISGTTGSPTITNYTDGEGTWRAYEFTANGSFTVSSSGGLEYELVAGGGGGGGGIQYTRGGGGGAGGVLKGTTTLTPGTYSVVVGSGGAGGTTAARSTNGGDTVALGLTAVGGGAGGMGTDNTRNALAGGSGGGGKGASSPGAAGTAGQGNSGGAGYANSGGGGGGAGAAGGAGALNNVNTSPAGSGGAGITSIITGASQQIAGGGGGSGGTGGAASHGGGAGAANASVVAGGNATAAGAGGGAADQQANGGNGYRGRFVLRVKTA